MYRESAEYIQTKGLSLTSRIILGIVSILSAVLIGLAVFSKDPTNIIEYISVGFCFLMGIVFLTAGRIRQFFGSVLGASLFFIGVSYVSSMISTGAAFSGGRGDPTLLNSLLFLCFFGFPGIGYAIKTRFGYKPTPPNE